jgi:hypothetical protein
MESIFEKLDKLIKNTNVITESLEDGDEVGVEIDDEYKTSEQGITQAVLDVLNRVRNIEGKKEGSGDDTGGEKPGGDDTDSVTDKPYDDGGAGGDGDGSLFKSSTMDDMDDIEKLEDPKSEDDEDDESDKHEPDFEFDDFDYDSDSRHGETGDEEGDDFGGSSPSGDDEDEYEDGDFGDDDDLGDDDDWDFGDDSGDDSSSGGSDEDGDFDDGDSEGEGSGGSSSKSSGGSSSSHGGTSGSSSSGDSGDGSDDDVDYDDTIDYDSEDYDSLESEIKDALDRTKEGTSSSSEKELLDKMKDSFGDSEDGKSSEEKASDLKEDIDKATDETKSGSGELAGETLEDAPDDDLFTDDMKKGGFDPKDIEKMKKDKNTDTSDEMEDDETIAKEAAEELEKKAAESGKSGSSLAKGILRGVLKGKITNMEWKEMVKIFLRSKSKRSGTSSSKYKKTTWGDKKHLWRDAVLPKSSPAGGEIEQINCFIDFSGSVSQPLVFTFLQRVLDFCRKLAFNEVNIYGFGERLSKPYKVKERDIRNKAKFEDLLKDIWKFISDQGLGGGIENFEAVSLEILKLKRRNHDCPIFIFGDGLWATSYSNPKDPKYLKQNCSRYLKDILCLVYYDKSWGDFAERILGPEIGYLKDIAGIKQVVTTEISELEKDDISGEV